MMTVDTTVMLARYSDWADQVLFKAMQSLPDGVMYKESKTLFKSMAGTLNHNYLVDLIWRAHLQGREHGFSTRRGVLFPKFEDLIVEQTNVNQWYLDWARNQDSETLSEPLKFNFVDGKPGKMTRGQMFLHIVNHKTYHRGWVSQMFFEFDVDPPETDICVFLCK